jgi:hypothetical protein
VGEHLPPVFPGRPPQRCSIHCAQPSRGRRRGTAVTCLQLQLHGSCAQTSPFVDHWHAGHEGVLRTQPSDAQRICYHPCRSCRDRSSTQKLHIHLSNLIWACLRLKLILDSRQVVRRRQRSTAWSVSLATGCHCRGKPLVRSKHRTSQSSQSLLTEGGTEVLLLHGCAAQHDWVLLGSGEPNKEENFGSLSPAARLQTHLPLLAATACDNEVTTASLQRAPTRTPG